MHGRRRQLLLTSAGHDNCIHRRTTIMTDRITTGLLKTIAVASLPILSATGSVAPLGVIRNTKHAFVRYIIPRRLTAGRYSAKPEGMVMCFILPLQPVRSIYYLAGELCFVFRR